MLLLRLVSVYFVVALLPDTGWGGFVAIQVSPSATCSISGLPQSTPGLCLISCPSAQWMTLSVSLGAAIELYTCVPQAVLTALSPVYVYEAVNTQVQVQGSNFYASKDQILCKFGTTLGTGHYISPSQVNCDWTPLLAGSYQLSLSFNRYDWTNSLTLQVKVTPRVHSMTATSSYTPTTLLITGAYLVDQLKCLYEGLGETTITRSGTISGTCPVPTVALGTVVVQVVDALLIGLSEKVNLVFLSRVMISASYPVYVNTNSHVEVFGMGFGSAMVCAWNGIVAKTSWMTNQHIRCSTLGLAAGLYALTLQDSSGTVVSATPLSLTIHADHYQLTSSLVGNNTLITLSPSAPTAKLLCKAGKHPALLMTAASGGWLCPTGLLQDVGTLCLEVSFNEGYDYTSDCQVTVWLPRISRTTSVQPTKLPLNGGEIEVKGVKFYDESSYECRLQYPDGSVQLVKAVSISATVLTCSVPSATLSGTVALQVMQNKVVPLELLSFTMVDSVQLIALDPPRIMLSGNSLLTLSGLHIPAATQCAFTAASGAEYVSPAIVVSPSTATCLSPDFSTEGPGEVSVSLYEFDGSLSASLNITVVPEPIVHSLEPNYAFEEAITTLFLRGEGFLPVAELKARLYLSEQVASTTYVSDSLLQVTFRALAFNHRIYSSEQVSVTLNGQDYFGAAELTILPSPSLGLANITKGPWQGGYAVLLHGNGFVRDGSCLFGDQAGEGVVVAYGEMRCSVPMALPGVVRVAVEILQTLFQDKPVMFTFLGFSDYTFTPISGPLYGGTVVTIVGDFSWIQPTDVIQCDFGGQLSSASLLDSQITCSSPPRSVSELVFLHLIVGGFDYSQTGLTSKQFFYESDPSLGVASAYVYSSNGGTLVELTGTGFQWRSAWKCHFGSFTQDLYVLESTLAACFSPHTLFGLSSTLKLSSDLQHFLPFSQPFAVVPDPSIYLCTPSLGPRAGGTLVILTGDHLTSVVNCRFGNLLAVPATFISVNQVTCMTPEWAVPGSVQVDISVNGQLYSNSGVMFQYYDLPLVEAVHPTLVPADGGTKLTIEGNGFLDPIWCRINGIVIASDFFSSTRVTCVAPSTPAGAVDIALSYNGQQFHSFLHATYTAYADFVVTGLAPRYGVAGTIVTVTGSGFTAMGSLSCRFGLTEASWKQVLSTTTLQCQVPVLSPGPYTLQVSINGVDFMGNQAFTVHWELAVLDAQPRYTSPEGGTEFRVKSLYWPEDAGLAKCGFRLTDPLIHTSEYRDGFREPFNQPASVLNSLTLCSSPPLSLGQAQGKLQLSSDSQVYSSSSTPLSFYEGSFEGFFRQASVQVECPAGSFCRTERWYSASLCESGYWQSDKRSRKCRTCGRGQYCGDRGMTVPSVCEAGRVCAGRGLTGSLLDCPSGFFCLAGTIEASFWQDSPYFLKPQMCMVIGQYCPVGSKQQSDSKTCSDGFYCPVGAKEHYGVLPCPVGFYCLNSVIYPCPPRHYCPERGNTKPRLCPSGTYNPFPSQSACLPCAYGSICPHDGMLLPHPCPVGYICNETGLLNPTVMCTAGYYCDGLVTSAFTKRPCRVISDVNALSLSFCGVDTMVTKSDPNNISADMPHFTGKTENMCCWSPGTTSAFLGNLSPSAAFQRLQEEAWEQTLTGMDLYRLLTAPQARALQATRTVQLSPIRPEDVQILAQSLEALLLLKQPAPCPPGMFCLQKTGSNSTSSFLPPYQCSPGTYCELAASSPQGTGLCPSGYYCPAGTSEPLQTQPGYRTELSGNVNPAPCMPGYFSNQAVTSVCLPCPSGFECTNSGTVWPSICPAGTYRSNGDMSRCTSCPVRAWSYEKGLTSVQYCLPCPAGRLCSEPGIQTVSQTYPCIEGDICSEAADLTTRAGCPTGYLCPMGTSPDSAYDNECIEGFFCKSRTPYRNKYLLQCPTFSYCPYATPEYKVFFATDSDITSVNLPPTMCPLGTGNDGKSGKKQLLDCAMDSEFTPQATPRQYVVEVNPVNVSLGTPPSGYTDSNVTMLPYYSLGTFDVVLVTLDLRQVDLAEGLLAYGKYWSIAVTVTSNDTIEARTEAVPIPMPLNFLNETVAKNSVLEFTFQALAPANLTVSILLFNGLLLSQQHTFYETTSVEVFSPNRANYGSRDVFMAFFDSSVALPINLPSTEASIIPEYLISFAESPHRYPEIRTPQVEGYNSFTPDSMFWQGEESYMVPYLPYFSNCKGYGGYIPIWALLELHSSCDLVSPDNTTYISSFDFGAQPSADSCSNITIECIYDEVPNNQEPLPRWWEQTFPSYVFSLSQTPLSPEDFRAGNIPGSIPVEIINLNAGSGLPRTVTLDIKYQQVDTTTKKIIQASITFSDFLDVTSNQNSGLEITKYNLIVNFSALTHTELMILFQFPISFYAVLNLIIGMAMVGVMLTFFGYHRLLTKAKPVPRFKCWGFVVMIFPPLLAGMALATVPMYAVCMVISLFVEGSVWTDVLIYPDTQTDGTTQGIFDSIKPAYDLQDLSDMTMYRQCRTAVSLMLLGLYLLGVSSALFVPYSARDKHKLYEEDPKGNVLRTVYWRRFSFVFISLLTCCGALLCVFFSYSDYFAINVYPCIAALQVLGMVYEEVMEGIIGSSLMKAPLMAFIAVVQGLCTFGASDFVDFLQANFVDFAIMLHNRMFNEDVKGWVTDNVKAISKKVKHIVEEGGIHKNHSAVRLDELLTQDTGRVAPIAHMASDPIEDESFSSIEESDSASFYTYEEVRESPPPSEHAPELLLEQDVEPLLDNLGDYTADAIGMVYSVVIITLMWYFYDTTQMAANYGIEKGSVELFFLYGVMVLPFQFVIDVLLHNSNELFNGWAMHDFLDHLSQRYRSRTTAWSVCDTQNADFIEESNRTLYNTCFSSQYFFMCTLHCSGMVLVLLSVHVFLLNDTYNIFQDKALLAIIPFIVAFCVIVHYLSYRLGILVRLWRVPNSNSSHTGSEEPRGPSFRELVETFMQARESKASRVVPAIQNWMQVDLVKAGDEVIRRELNSARLREKKVREMFLSENREWLQHNLEHILTVNNLKKHRGLLLDKFQEMFGPLSQEMSPRIYSDFNTPEEVEPLTSPSARVMLYWLSRAKRIQQLRAQTEGLVAAHLGLKCQYCGNQSSLQCELIESVEDLFFRFKAAQRPPLRFQANLWDTGDWLEFVSTEGHFRTLCLNCLALCDQFNAEAAKMRKKTRPETLPSRNRAVNFADAPGEVQEGPLPVLVRAWLEEARRRLRVSSS